MAENKEKTGENKLEAVDLNRLILDMINKLPERSRNIIIKRFNLDNKGVKTLDEIGKEYEITRERVRQIEVETMAKLKKTSRKYNLDEALNYIKESVKNHGGIMSKEKIIKIFLDGENFKANKQTMLLILSLDDKIKTLRETKIYKKIYFYEEENVLKFEKAIEKIKNYLQEKNRSIGFDKIAEIINEDAKITNSYIEANKIILKNILGEWGCEKWSYINPKNIKDKSYLSLKKIKNLFTLLKLLMK